MAAPGQVVRRRDAGAGRLAGRRDRRRQHPRPVRGPAAPQGDRGGGRRAGDRHRARRRVPLHVTRPAEPAQPSLRSRSGVVGVGRGAVGGRADRRRRTCCSPACSARQADGVLRARAEATAATVQAGAGRRRVGRATPATTGRSTSGPGSSPPTARSWSGPRAAPPRLDRRGRGARRPRRAGASTTGRRGPGPAAGAAGARRRRAGRHRGDQHVAGALPAGAAAGARSAARRSALVLLVVVHLVLRANVAPGAAAGAADERARRAGGAPTTSTAGSAPTPRPAELDELAGTLDGVLDRLSAVLRHERQLSDELSPRAADAAGPHPGGGGPARRPPARPAERRRGAGAIDEAAGAMRDILETLMTTARAAAATAPGRSAPRPRSLRRWRRSRRAPSATLDVVVTSPAGPGGRASTARCCSSALVARWSTTPSAMPRPGDRVGRAGPSAACCCGSPTTGPGVPPEDAERVFEPGWRGDPGDGHDGAGLGLALAARLADRGRWPPGARPRGLGATFVVRLPGG